MRNQQAGMTFILITVFIDMIGLGIVFPILPQLIASFLNNDVSAAAQYYGYFVALFAAMQFLFAPVLGSLSDQVGRRSVLLVSLFGAALDYALLSFAPTLWLLFVGRIIAGVTAASFTVANAYIADVSPPEKRAQNFGMIGAAFGLGFIIGPLLGGLLGQFGPRVPFMVAGLLTIVNWLYGYFVLPESLAPENRRHFSLAHANPLGSVRALGRYPIVFSLTAAIVCSSLAQQGLIAVWVLYTTYRYGWDSLQQGLSLAAVGVVSVIMQGGLVGVIMSRLGERRALLVGLTSSLIGLILYGAASQGWMMYAIIIGTAPSSLWQPAAQGIISNSVKRDEQGKIQGALTSIMSLTGVFGPVIGTTVFAVFTAPEQPVHVPGAPFFLGAGLTVFALFFVMRTLRRFPRKAATLAQG